MAPVSSAATSNSIPGRCGKRRLHQPAGAPSTSTRRNSRRMSASRSSSRSTTSRDEKAGIAHVGGEPLPPQAHQARGRRLRMRSIMRGLWGADAAAAKAGRWSERASAWRSGSWHEPQASSRLAVSTPGQHTATADPAPVPQRKAPAARRPAPAPARSWRHGSPSAPRRPQHRARRRSARPAAPSATPPAPPGQRPGRQRLHRTGRV